VIGRAGEVDVRVLGRGEPRPGEVDVTVTLAPGAVGLDGGLVVEDAEQPRCRRAAGDDGRTEELLSVVRRRQAVGPCCVPEARDEDVAKRLRGAGRIAGALRAHEDAAVHVPRDHRITRARRSGLREPRVRRRIAGIAGNERALEAPARVLRAVVAEPDGAVRNGQSVGLRRIHPAVVVRAADQDARVARIELDGRLVLPSVRDRALLDHRVVRNRLTRGDGVLIFVARIHRPG